MDGEGSIIVPSFHFSFLFDIKRRKKSWCLFFWDSKQFSTLVFLIFIFFLFSVECGIKKNYICYYFSSLVVTIREAKEYTIGEENGKRNFSLLYSSVVHISKKGYVSIHLLFNILLFIVLQRKLALCIYHLTLKLEWKF